MLATNAARCLNVLGRRLWLSSDNHEPEPVDVDAHGNHVGGEQHIDWTV